MRTIVRKHARAALAALVISTGALLAPLAHAAPCAGFTDVDSSSGFCPNVEWIKNRSITLGCTSATLYCPDAVVSRIAMAAFMNRLGTALTPVHIRVESPLAGPLDPDLGPVVCATADFEAASFPRSAYVDVTFNGNGTSDIGVAADIVVSTDGGATWSAVNATVNRGSIPANQWGALSDIAFAELDVGQTVRWGVRITRGGAAGSGDVQFARCQLRALIYSRTGAASPL